MSLIRARRERRDLGGSGPRQPLSLGRLLLLLVLVIGLIVWLGSLSG